MEERKTNRVNSKMASTPCLQAVFQVPAQRDKRPNKICIKVAEIRVCEGEDS